MLPFIRSEIAQMSAYKPHPGDEIDGADAAPPLSLDRLDTNECPFDLPADLKQKLARTYQQTIEANRYPDGEHGDLKRAIADYVNESAYVNKSAAAPSANPEPDASPPPSIGPVNLSIGNGSDELIRSILIATCLGSEGAILMAQPTFSMYGILARTLGIPVVTVDRSPDTFEMNMAAANRMIKQNDPPIRAIFAVHPNSPTGNCLTGCELAWLRQLPASILIAIDEAYFEFSQETVLAELQHHPNWMVLRTFSKAFRLATHRMGYAIGHPELIAALEKVRLPYNLPSLSQAAAALVLAERQQLLAVVPQIRTERDQLFQKLSQNPALQVWPGAGNFLYLRPQLPAKGSRDRTAELEQVLRDLCQQLKAQGTLVRHTGGGLRLTIGSPEENARSYSHLQTALAQQGRFEF